MKPMKLPAKLNLLLHKDFDVLGLFMILNILFIVLYIIIIFVFFWI